MDVTHAIVKVNVTECNDAIKRKASLVMPDSDHRDVFFYLPLTQMIDSYIKLPHHPSPNNFLAYRANAVSLLQSFIRLSFV